MNSHQKVLDKDQIQGKRSHPLCFYAVAGIAGSGGSSMPLRAARMTVPR